MDMGVKIDWKPKVIEKNLIKHKNIVQKGMEKGLELIIEQAGEGGQDVLAERSPTKGNKNIMASLNPGHSKNISKVMSSRKAQVGTNYPGANLVKEGTKPHNPPWASIESWVRENTGALRVGDIGSATHRIREHIASHGTEKTEFLSKGIKEKEKEMNKAIDQAAENILKELGLKK